MSSKSEEKDGLTAVASTVLVRRQIGPKEAEIEEETKVIEVHRFVTAPAEVGYEIGLTLNLGNYESARITVGVKLPCYVEELDVTLQRAKAWAEKHLETEKSGIAAGSKKSSNPFG